MTKPTVVLHIDEAGDVTIYADGEVNVIWCSDLVPADRLYRVTPAPIPADLLDGEIGHKTDNSPAATRLSNAIKEANGFPTLEVIR